MQCDRLMMVLPGLLRQAIIDKIGNNANTFASGFILIVHTATILLQSSFMCLSHFRPGRLGPLHPTASTSFFFCSTYCTCMLSIPMTSIHSSVQVLRTKLEGCRVLSANMVQDFLVTSEMINRAAPVSTTMSSFFPFSSICTLMR